MTWIDTLNNGANFACPIDRGSMNHLGDGDEKCDKDNLGEKKGGWGYGTVESITFSWACNAITEAQILQLTPFVHS